MQKLLADIRSCTLCKNELPNPPKPILSASSKSPILLVGQAPGSRVQASGIAWDDPSGDLLREWLEVDKTTFYNTNYFAIVPMGFCYPGKGKSGDLPPRTECAPTWHPLLLETMRSVRVTILIGQYSQKQYLADQFKKNLTETVRHADDYLPRFFPLPHPSPRNRIWMKKNPWFDRDIIPLLRSTLKPLLHQ